MTAKPASKAKPPGSKPSGQNPQPAWPKASPFDTWEMFFAPQARMAEALIKHNIEMLEFLKTRFERDRALLDDLAKARSQAEAGQLWQEFWGRMLSDYSSETNKLAASASEIAETALRSASEEGAALVAAARPEPK